MHSSTDTTHIAGAKETSALQHFFARVRDWFRGRTIEDRAELLSFLDANAALVAQKCAMDYCRGKTGAASHALFKEQVFIDALERCRWEGYAAVLSDLTLIAESRLAGEARTLGKLAQLKPALAQLYAEALKAHPLPAYRPEGWDDAIAEFARRQASFDPLADEMPDSIAKYSARKLFDALPIHTSMRKFDEEIVFGAVRFHVVGFSQRLGTQLKVASVANSLLAD